MGKVKVKVKERERKGKMNELSIALQRILDERADIIAHSGFPPPVLYAGFDTPEYGHVTLAGEGLNDFIAALRKGWDWRGWTTTPAPIPAGWEPLPYIHLYIERFQGRRQDLLGAGGGSMSSTALAQFIMTPAGELKRPVIVRTRGELAARTDQALVPARVGDIIARVRSGRSWAEMSDDLALFQIVAVVRHPQICGTSHNKQVCHDSPEAVAAALDNATLFEKALLILKRGEDAILRYHNRSYPW